MTCRHAKAFTAKLFLTRAGGVEACCLAGLGEGDELDIEQQRRVGRDDLQQ